MTGLPRFAFRARDEQGQRIAGQLDAISEDEALRLLRAKGVYPLGLRRCVHSPWLSLARDRHLSTRELAVFVRQFGTAVRAGLPVLRALRLLSSQSTGARPAARLAGRVADRVESGASLTQAFAPEGPVLPATFLPFIAAGETAGALDDVLVRLSEFYERQDAFESRLRSALAYPTVVVALTFAVVLFLLTTVVPSFGTLYSAFHAPLPALTRTMLAASGYLQSRWWSVLLVLASVVALAVLLSRQPAVRRGLEPVHRRLPVFGQLSLHGGLARFCRTLATLLRAGVPILEALTVSQEMLPFATSRQRVAAATASVRQGGKLSSALAGAAQDFPPLLVAMVAVGEESGQVDEMLERAASFLERDVEATASRLTALLEPALVVALGAVVATIIGSVLVPMYSVFQYVR